MSTKNTTILISGASIAGPTLAYWLKRSGFTPTVIERAPQLRAGGYPVDVRYEAKHVARLMGIWPPLQQEKTSFSEISFVNERNERIGSINGQAMRQTFDLDVVEIMRGDLAKILYELTKDEVEYCFGDSIHEACAQLYGVPGKQVVLRSTRGNQVLVAFFLFKQPTRLRYDYHDLAQHKQLLAEVFAGEGWEVPRLLEKMHTAPDLYFDAVSQMRMPRWSDGRAVLLGDAGYCPALLSGQGSTLAMMGAYVLAGELKVALGDHKLAFAQYEQVFRPIVSRVQKQAGASARFLVPATPLGLWVQTHLIPRLVPPLLVAIEHGRRLLPRSSSKPSRVKDYGNVLPPS